MKKLCIFFLLSIIISLTAFGFSQSSLRMGQTQTQYLRMHIRANSNSLPDQTVKYKVRDALVEYLTPIVAECSSIERAEKIISAHTAQLSCEAERVLTSSGFSYGATAQVKWEYFPTRVYKEYVLEAGEYLSLIVNLGEGAGANWWCVVYPPLCFAAPSGVNVRYKSKILEIIRLWQKNVFK